MPPSYLSLAFILYFNRYELTTDAMLLAVSERVVTPEHEDKLRTLFIQYSEILQPDTWDAGLRDVDYNKNWLISDKVSTLHEFVTNFFNELKESEQNLRLPKASKPISYELNLEMELNDGALPVNAEVTIRLRILERTDRLVLHSRNLTIEDLKLFDAFSGTEAAIINYSLYSPTDMLTVYLADDAAVGAEYNLRVKYGFSINNLPSQTGLYLASYPNNVAVTS